ARSVRHSCLDQDAFSFASWFFAARERKVGAALQRTRPVARGRRGGHTNREAWCGLVWKLACDRDWPAHGGRVVYAGKPCRRGESPSWPRLRWSKVDLLNGPGMTQDAAPRPRGAARVVNRRADRALVGPASGWRASGNEGSANQVASSGRSTHLYTALTS